MTFSALLCGLLFIPFRFVFVPLRGQPFSVLSVSSVVKSNNSKTKAAIKKRTQSHATKSGGRIQHKKFIVTIAKF
jgi:hypothetical protein